VRPPFGEPKLTEAMNTVEICREGYLAIVDTHALVPRWVAYRLTGSHTF
jgi:hypothetical protein